MSRMRLVDRAAGILERRIDRRSVLVRAAIGGAALAVSPVDFTLRPMTAYAAICRCTSLRCTCGSRCCDGYTEFRCNVYGSNRCPPGSVIAGWWKADGSAFCGGGPRYYMDCNASCGGCGCSASGICSPGCTDVTCGCAFDDCDRWRINCVNFRYGQCNQHVACVGAITCRLVTCVPPWEIEPTCTTTVAVDQFTASHTAPCLIQGRGSVDVFALDRRTLRVAGWALLMTGATSLTMQYRVDGALVRTSPATLTRTDLAPYFPGLGTAHGFSAQFDISPGLHTVSVEAFAPDAPIDGFVVAARQIAVGLPFGALDVITQVPGGIEIAGWVIDPDSSEPVRVHVYVDGTLAAATETRLNRPDVEAAYPGFGRALGYSVFVPAAGGARTICAYAINAGDSSLNQLLGCRSISVRSAPAGVLDRVERAPGGVRIAGWAYDPQTGSPLVIHAYVDGAIAGTGRADRVRSDVGALLPKYGPSHGFDFVVPALPGRREICAYAIDTDGTAENSLLGCATVNVGSAPVSVLDAVRRSAEGVRIVGWTFDPNTRDPINVHVYVDGVLVTAARADAPRPDVAVTYQPYGEAHGFDVAVPISSAPHQVCVYAIGTTRGQNVLIACRTV
jgi:hypothetical protein